MKLFLRTIMAAALFGFVVNGYANEPAELSEEQIDKIVAQCEAQADGKEDPESFIESCVEKLSEKALKEQQ